MKKISRMFLFGALALVLLSAACAPEGAPPSVIDTIEASALTGSPVATDAIGTASTATVNLTSSVAITQTTATPGASTDVILLACQFCVDQIAHALLVLPQTSTFEVVLTTDASLAAPQPETGCITVDSFHDRQMVLCRATQNTSMTLNVCDNAGSCRPLSLDLQSCPVSSGAVTPRPSVEAATDTPPALTGSPPASSTDTPEVPTSTPPASSTDTPGVLPSTPTP